MFFGIGVEKRMKIYFDTEFTGLHKNTTLISIGMVSENGKTFYGEFTDYDRGQVDNWIQENVIANMLYRSMLVGCMGDERDMRCVGDTGRIRCALSEWLSQFDEVQLVSDVCHYDMVLFCDIYGGAFQIPSNVSPCCYDLNQAIADYLGCSLKEAFDVSREGLKETLALGVVIEGEKHNSLYDARVIKVLYEAIQNGETK